MFTKARKIQLQEEVLKVGNEATLLELEIVLNNSKKRQEKKALSAHKFSGLWSRKDAALIENAINEGSEEKLTLSKLKIGDT
jgi:hypothetical protein